MQKTILALTYAAFSCGVYADVTVILPKNN